MAIQVRTPLMIVCDLESERDLNWGSVVVINTLDTGKWWKIVSGAYVEIQSVAIFPSQCPIIISQTQPSSPTMNQLWLDIS